MAPSPPENDEDGPPKAPDKRDGKDKEDVKDTKNGKERKPDDPNKQEPDFYNLNEKDLKHLLDEAISYKSPKDREGKSELFNNLLTDAENELRNARATSASGPETVRHYNKRATKRHHHGKGGGASGRKANSISENLTHSGSLNNLTKEDLFEESSVRQRLKKTVSARQTEGGSLPCNVNVRSLDQYLDDFRPMRELTEVKFTPDERKKNENDVIETFAAARKAKKTQKINVDERIPILDNLPTVDVVEYKKSTDTTVANSFVPVNLTSSLASFNGRPVHREEKKVDENCNAVPQQQQQQQQQQHQQQLGDGRKKSKKRPMEKNVTVLESSKVTGHRYDIINDVDKLIDYIAGTDVRKDNAKSSGNKQNLPGKKNPQKQQQQQQQHQQLFAEDANKAKKQRSRTAKPKAGTNLQKSNSLEEMSTTKIEDFDFEDNDRDVKVVLRQAKSGGDRPRERRSWGTSEPVVQVHHQTLYASATSAENLESADFRIVTKKKKSKKQQQRRNSLSSRKTYNQETANELTRVPSPEPPRRRKSASISAPHSDKSNFDSSDDNDESGPDCADKDVLGEDETNQMVMISYADIAKNSNNNGNVSNNNNNNSVINNSVSASGVNNNNNVKKEKVKSDEDKEKDSKKVKYTENFPSIEKVKVTSAMQIEIQNWPAILPINNNNNKNNLKNLKQKNHVKKSNATTNNLKIKSPNIIYHNYHPNSVNINSINIPDVRSIEKQLKTAYEVSNLSAAQEQPLVVPPTQNVAPPDCNKHDKESKTLEQNEIPELSKPQLESRTLQPVNKVATTPQPHHYQSHHEDHHVLSDHQRPAVVMLSRTEAEDVSGITFGFDFEQLLSNDDVCGDFIARWVPPPKSCDVGRSFNLDKIVNFIGIAWEDVVKETNGKVQYYTESL